MRVAAWGSGGRRLLCTALLAWYLASLPAGDREDVSSLPVVLGCLATLYLAMILGLVRWNRWAAAIAEGRPMRATPQEKPETVQVGIMLAAH
ncbi:hypothetical protein HS125_14350 [bacterium]|nr:hypothetical protein [bacterium]